MLLIRLTSNKIADNFGECFVVDRYSDRSRLSTASAPFLPTPRLLAKIPDILPAVFFQYFIGFSRYEGAKHAETHKNSLFAIK